jgi:hypothetical protein
MVARIAATNPRVNITLIMERSSHNGLRIVANLTVPYRRNKSKNDKITPKNNELTSIATASKPK